MKKTLLLLAVSLSIALSSCKNTEEKSEVVESDPNVTEQVESFPIYRGEFIYLKKENAAVLNGGNFIYGVVIDDMSKALGAQVQAVVTDPLDMVPVVVRGLVSKNPEYKGEGETWEELITIKEIIAVSDKPAEADIKIEETKE